MAPRRALAVRAAAAGRHARARKYELFERAWRKEARPFMGDTFAFAALDRLAPLLDDDDGVLRSTSAASASSPASEQFVTERWIGGVHVTADTPWRWDDAREAIT